MDFDDAKENIQPLASGRNAERLETAIIAESDHEIQEKLLEQRKEFERAIETYVGEDPLQPWYEYIEWVEQSYPKSGKETALNEMLSKCLSIFEGDVRYNQDRRMLKLYIKYIDSEPNPPQFYELLYNNGIGTMLADLYLCWAHYYDYADNFEKAESIYRKGLDARAQPLEQLEQAHKQFGFSMSQRLLYKDESTRQRFLTSMDEQRLALTSLRAHRHRHVGSIRTGSAVKSYNPGRVEQNVSGGRAHSSNRTVQIFEDENQPMNSQTAAFTSPAPAPASTSMGVTSQSTSIVQTILNSTKKQENLREPGPWTKAKLKTTRPFSGTCSQKLGFSILEDDDLIPITEDENNYAKGLQLPAGFVKRNLPQKDFKLPLHRDEEGGKKSMPAYDKFMLFPSKDKCFSLEELTAYKWFKKRNIRNHFTQEQDLVWECGHNIPIRLPPHFCRQNGKQDDWIVEPLNPNDIIADGKRKFGFDIGQIYSTEEYCPEEVLQSKWINGELFSQMQNEMDLTHSFNRIEEVFVANVKRRSMVLGGRKSIIPIRSAERSISPRKSLLHRKSIAPPDAIAPPPGAITPTPNAIASPPNAIVPPPLTNVSENATGLEQVEVVGNVTGAIRKVSLSKRKSLNTVKIAAMTSSETASQPLKFSVFEDTEPKAPEKIDTIFKTPQLPPMNKPRISSIFQDEELDGCTTQTFNFFIQSQSVSTPKFDKKQSQLMRTSDEATMEHRKEFDFVNNENISPIRTSPEQENPNNYVKQPFACRISDSEVASTQLSPDQQEFVRPLKLSAIMETTEETNTVSSAGTISSKSSLAEEFDFTKPQHQHTLAQSTYKNTSEYRGHTTVEITTKLSPPVVANINLPKKSIAAAAGSTIGFEIYQEESDQNEIVENTKLQNFKANVIVAGSDENVEGLTPAVHAKKTLESQSGSSQSKLYDQTSPASGQFHIYEDDVTATASMHILPTHKVDAIVENKIEMAPKSIEHSKTNGKSIFNIFQEDTAPSLCVMNFAEEKTETIPEFVNRNQSINRSIYPSVANPINDKLIFPKLPDQTLPSMCPIDLTEDQTEIIPKGILKRTEPASHENKTKPFTLGHQSQIGNKSMFQMPLDDSVPSIKEEKTENMSRFVNKNQTVNRKADVTLLVNPTNDKSLFQQFFDQTLPVRPENAFDEHQMGNLQTIPMLHGSSAKLSSDVQTQSKTKTIPKIDNQSSEKNQSLFTIYRDDTETVLDYMCRAKSASATTAPQTDKFNQSQNGSLVARHTEECESNMPIKDVNRPAFCNESKLNIKTARSQSNASTKLASDSKLSAANLSVLQTEFDEVNLVSADNKSQGFQQKENSPKMSPSPIGLVAKKTTFDLGNEYKSSGQSEKSLRSEALSAPKPTKPATNVDDYLRNLLASPASTSTTSNTINSLPHRVQPEPANILTTVSTALRVPKQSIKSVDDDLYDLIRSPASKSAFFKNPLPVNSDFEPSEKALDSGRERRSLWPSSTNKPSIFGTKFRKSSQSLLQPMKEMSVNEYKKEVAADSARHPHYDVQTSFSEENPNTALFSLNMTSIKNSTVISTSTENINTSTVDLQKESIYIKDEPASIPLETTGFDQLSPISKPIRTKLSMALSEERNKIQPSSEISQFSLQKPLNRPLTEQLSPTLMPITIPNNKNANDGIDEFYNMAQSPGDHMKIADISGIIYDEVERNLLIQHNLKKMQSSFPKIQISEPKTIRSSQFPLDQTSTGFTQQYSQHTLYDAPNEVTQPLPPFQLSEPKTIRPSQFQFDETRTGYTMQGSEHMLHEATKDGRQSLPPFQLFEPKNTRPSVFESMTSTIQPPIDSSIQKIDDSVYIVEPTMDLAIHSKVQANNEKGSQTQSPFRSHFGGGDAKPNNSMEKLKEIDPFDIHVQNVLLEDIDFIGYIERDTDAIVENRIRNLQTGAEFSIGNSVFNITKMIYEGNFGSIYCGKCLRSEKVYAFKQEFPANLWEFYISLEIGSRIEDQRILPGFLFIEYAHVAKNSSVFASEYSEFGSLLSICKKHKESTLRNLDEIIVMILANQMLSIIDHLHALSIIHGNIKSENFLLMKRLSYGHNEISLKLIDYRRSIDLNFFPNNQTFTTKSNVNRFVCTEMMENRPWRFQIDLFCLASTIYSLLCGKDMNVVKNPESKLRPYVLKEGLPPHSEQILWENVLYALINVRDCNSLPNLQNLRLQIREMLAAKERFLDDKIWKFNSVLDD